MATQFRTTSGVEAHAGLLCASASALVMLTVLNEPAASIAATAPRNWARWRLYRVTAITLFAGGLLVVARPSCGAGCACPADRSPG